MNRDLSLNPQIHNTHVGSLYLDEHDSLGLSNGGVHEPIETSWIQSHIKKTDVCLDIGAHIGYFTLLMAKYSKWVYAFEPERKNFWLLFKNLSENKIDNVSPYRAAVAGYTTNQNLFLCSSNSGMHRIYPSKWNDDGLQSIDTISIDSMDEIGDNITFIKMDIEGAEYSALKGMRRLLERCKPTVMMEFYPPAIKEYGTSPKDICDFVWSLGYSIRLFPAWQTPISYDALVRQTSGDNQAGQNILCINQP